jgi:hypothetical protein
VFSKSKIFKFLKRDWGTIPVAEIINGKIEFFSNYNFTIIVPNAFNYLKNVTTWEQRSVEL